METAVSTAGRSCPRCTMVHEESFAFCPTTGEPLGDAHIPSVGAKVDGRYLLEQLIRQDELYRVYRGRDLQNEAPVALWFLAEAAQAPDLLQEQFFDALRVRQEKNVIPHSEPIIAIGQSDSFGPYGVCPALEGETLLAYVDERGVLSPQQAKAAFDQLILSVTALADAGLVGECPHPSRIFMDAGTEKIWLLGAGLPNPSSSFSAGNALAEKDDKRRFQEQAASLGECLLWMLTGQSPSGDMGLQMLDDLPRGVTAFLRCCLGKPVGYTNLKELVQAWRGAFLETSGQTLALPVLAEVTPIQLKAEKRLTNGASGSRGTHRSAVRAAAPAKAALAGEAVDPIEDEIEESFWNGDLVSNTGYDWNAQRGPRKGILIGAAIGGVVLFLGFGYLVANRDSGSTSPTIASEKEGGTPAKRAASQPRGPSQPDSNGSAESEGRIPSETAEGAAAMGAAAPIAQPDELAATPSSGEVEATGVAPAPMPAGEQPLAPEQAALPGAGEQPVLDKPMRNDSPATAGLKPFPSSTGEMAPAGGDVEPAAAPHVPAWVKEAGEERAEQAARERKAAALKVIAQEREQVREASDVRAAAALEDKRIKAQAAKPPAVRLSTSTKTGTGTKGSNGGAKASPAAPTANPTGSTSSGTVKSKRIIEENPY